MYHHVRGTLTHINPAMAVIDAGGVGFQFAISFTTHRDMPLPGKEAMLYAHLAVRDTEHVLYGFATERERELFRALIGVNGVGPATALQVLSGTTATDFARAVESQDHTALKKIKGIGEKTAKRIILELKGSTSFAALATGSEGGVAASSSDPAAAARQALETLGIPAREAGSRVERVLKAQSDLTVEEIIRAALQ